MLRKLYSFNVRYEYCKDVLKWTFLYIDCDYKPTLLLSNTTGATSGAGVAYPSGEHELTLVFVGFVLLQL